MHRADPTSRRNKVDPRHAGLASSGRNLAWAARCGHGRAPLEYATNRASTGCATAGYTARSARAHAGRRRDTPSSLKPDLTEPSIDELNLYQLNALRRIELTCPERAESPNPKQLHVLSTDNTPIPCNRASGVIDACVDPWTRDAESIRLEWFAVTGYSEDGCISVKD